MCVCVCVCVCACLLQSLFSCVFMHMHTFILCVQMCVCMCASVSVCALEATYPEAVTDGL